jgi:integrase/recombinase XerD
MVREGKGRKQRVVPIGKRALTWIEKYLRESRPLLVVPPDEGHLFLTQYGKGYPPNSISAVARRYILRAEIGKPGSAHIFRHTMATLMLENGADVRYVQEMLGHATISTTQVYTHVAIRKLREVHDATHPAEAPHASAGGIVEEPASPPDDEPLPTAPEP